MTDKTNAARIAEARRAAGALEEYELEGVAGDAAGHLSWLADALEAADQRAEQAEAEVEGMLSDSTRWMNRALPAEQRVAEYAAVVEKAEDFVTWHYPDTRFGDEVLPILASAGADVLREHDAALIGRLADEAGYFLVHHKEAVAFLRREARQRREEQGHG